MPPEFSEQTKDSFRTDKTDIARFPPSKALKTRLQRPPKAGF